MATSSNDGNLGTEIMETLSVSFLKAGLFHKAGWLAIYQIMIILDWIEIGLN